MSATSAGTAGPGAAGHGATTRRLGRAGVAISPLTLGTENLARLDDDTAVALVQTALDAGITAVATADGYGEGRVERLVGKAIRGRRDEVFVATSFGHVLGGDPARGGSSRRWITQAVEGSLRRLGTDRIDLYQAHRPDPFTALDETLATLEELARHGKIRYSGTSGFPAEEIVEAQWIAGGPWGPVTEQVPYSLLVRTPERTVLPAVHRFRLGFLAAAPLAEGWLSGGYRVDAGRPVSRRAEHDPVRFDARSVRNEAKLAAADALGRLADAAGLTLVELAVAFGLTHPDVSSVVVGPRTPSHLDAYVQGSFVQLGDDVLDAIDRIVPPGTHLLERDTGAATPALTPERLRA
jgi:aryl-alcohol dehydrogenase-like predicted oxidoreductase